MEEDGEDNSNGSGDVWDESLEAPFWIKIQVSSFSLAMWKVTYHLWLTVICGPLVPNVLLPLFPETKQKC